MATRAYYEVDEKAYLFGKSKSGPEEPVRQWALFELMTHYGYNINDLSIEHPVRVGSKTYHADIVVKREQVPFIVFECKKRGTRKEDQGSSQAVSYANVDNFEDKAKTLKTEFAVYSDGDSWIVRRRTRDNWHVVPDIPTVHAARNQSQLLLNALLWEIHKIKHLFLWTYCSIPSNHAQEYFSTLQTFFHSSVFLEGVNVDLLVGTDNLLRVLGTNHIFEDDYSQGKLCVMRNRFEKYLVGIGFQEQPWPFRRESIHLEEIMSLESDFGKLAIESQIVNTEDAQVVRIISLLLIYLFQYAKDSKYHTIEQSLTDEVLYLLDSQLTSNINVKLPAKFDYESIRELKILAKEPSDTHS